MMLLKRKSLFVLLRRCKTAASRCFTTLAFTNLNKKCGKSSKSPWVDAEMCRLCCFVDFFPTESFYFAALNINNLPELHLTTCSDDFRDSSP